MIDFDALFKVSYGLYIVSSGSPEKGNGYISNTVFQVTAEPPKFATCCSKDNYTCDIIRHTGAFAVSVLSTETSSGLFGRFGYKSGKDSDKLEGMDIRKGETGVAIVLNEALAILECKLVQSLDVGTHILFIGDLVRAEVLDPDAEPITYLNYRNVRKAVAPKNAPTHIDKSKLAESASSRKVEKKELKQEAVELKKDESAETGVKAGTDRKFKCPACGYVYDEEEGNSGEGFPPGTSFGDIPDDWVCPLCGTEKEDFFEV